MVIHKYKIVFGPPPSIPLVTKNVKNSWNRDRIEKILSLGFHDTAVQRKSCYESEFHESLEKLEGYKDEQGANSAI